VSLGSSHHQFDDFMISGFGTSIDINININIMVSKAASGITINRFYE
jgi:hypothetical protein